MRLRVPYLRLAAFTLLTATAGLAQAPGRHPEYMHALADLRYARAYLSEPLHNGTINPNAQMAIQEIDRAIAEIKKASIDDGKNLNDHPPIDAQMQGSGRYHKALELIDQAHADVSHTEDMPNARELQTRIKEHLDAAHRYLDQAMGR